jgi:vacuolar protein-sorting-associated protein 4
MENKFIPDAIEIISKAIEADNAGEYEKALNFYRDALGRFTIGLKYEKNDARRKLVMERVDGYMKRAEELRDYINAQHEEDLPPNPEMTRTERTTTPKRKNCVGPCRGQSSLKSQMSSGQM